MIVLIPVSVYFMYYSVVSEITGFNVVGLGLKSIRKAPIFHVPLFPCQKSRGRGSLVHFLRQFYVHVAPTEALGVR